MHCNLLQLERVTEEEARAVAAAKLAETEKRQEMKRTAQLARHDMGVQQLWRGWQKREAVLMAELKKIEARLRSASERESLAQKTLASSEATHRQLALERERQSRGKTTEQEVLVSRERDLERQVAREAREERELTERLTKVEGRIDVLETQQREVRARTTTGAFEDNR